MEKLPLRPIFFVPAYLLLFVVSVSLASPKLGISNLWPWFFSLAGFALHFVWVFRALVFASGRLRFIGRGSSGSDALRIAGRFFMMMILCFGVATLYKAYLKPVVGSVTPLDETLEMLLALATLYFFLGIFWISARTLCEAELGGKATTYGTISTCLLLLNLFIGAPFIYRRLETLRELPPVRMTEPT